MVIPKPLTPRIDANWNGFADALGKLDKSHVERPNGVAADREQRRFVPARGQRFSLRISSVLGYRLTVFGCMTTRPTWIQLDSWGPKESGESTANLTSLCWLKLFVICV